MGGRFFVSTIHFPPKFGGIIADIDLNLAFSTDFGEIEADPKINQAQADLL